MSVRVLGAVVAGILVSGQAVAEEPRNGERVEVEASYVFVPVGFYDDDEAEVIIDGYLPSGCYRLAPPDIAVDSVEKTVKITPRARFFDVPCIEALVPYNFEAKLGQLSEGTYTIEVPSAGGLLTGELVVRRSDSPRVLGE